MSGKQGSSSLINRVSFCQKLEKNISTDQPPDGSRDFLPHNASSAVISQEISTKDDIIDDSYLDKCVVNGENKNFDLPNLAAVDVQESGDKLVVKNENTPKNAALPKIKWGDLDERTLINYRETFGSEIIFRGIENNILVSMKAGNSVESLDAAVLDSKRSELVGADEDDVLQESHSLSLRTVFIKEKCKEVNEVSSKDVKEQITCDNVFYPNINFSCVDTVDEVFRLDNDDTHNLSDSKTTCSNDAEVTETAFKPKSAYSYASSAEGTGKTNLQCEILRPEIIEPRSGGELMASSMKQCIEQKIQENDALLYPKIADGMDSDATTESKERFRERLWGFLFENLNRAVDELYLLCELECDLDQMKEASLVLEEAAMDFRELKSRVERFEKLKRFPSTGIDGVPSTSQSDHRRPHALSWEVRRMTTSPRRAEILSSSLEAFRKIQQERTSDRANNTGKLGSDFHSRHLKSGDTLEKCTQKGDMLDGPKESIVKGRKRAGDPVISHTSNKEKRNVDSGRTGSGASRLTLKEASASCAKGKSDREMQGAGFETEKLHHKKDKMLTEHAAEKKLKSTDTYRRHVLLSEKDGDKRNGYSGKSLDAWKEKRNWEDVLSSPHRFSSRFSYSPGLGRKSAERARVLHDKLMSPEKKKKSTLDLKKEAEEKHARATRIRTQLETERVQKLQRTSEKLNRVNEWQTVRSNKLRESMFARHQRNVSRHEAYLAEVVRRAGDESSKVNEVRFITSLNEENKKHILRKKLQDSELRRAEKIQVMKTKQKEDMAREEAVLERRRLIEAEKLLRLAETQRRKEEAQLRREEERKASSAAREARAMEQMRRKEVRAKAQQEEAELLAQKLAEKLSESEQRRRFYLEQIRERASMDFRDQSSPLLRRFTSKEGQAQGRSTPNNSGEENSEQNIGRIADSGPLKCEASQQSLKRRIKRIRQRLMSLKHEFPDPLVGLENFGIEYKTAVGTARVKIGKWLQDLKKLRQARKDGAASFGLITAEIIKYLDGRDPELHASRLAGLLDFIASALPASHTSKPEACQVTVFLLRLLRAVLAIPANRCYFLVQNLLPPIIPMLAAALECYIRIAASLNIPGSTNFDSNRTSIGNMELVTEIMDGFLWTAAAIIGQNSSNDLQLQMQNGLVELVIAYQIIRRLRDLFALYDRPQVEGSPFPSSIILSINFLAVLTSKFRETPIEWISFPNDAKQGDKIGGMKNSFHSDLGSNLCLSSRDGRSLRHLSGSLSAHLPDVPEGEPLYDTFIVERENVSIFIDNNLDGEHISSKIENACLMDDSFKIPTDYKCENLVNSDYGIDSRGHSAYQNNVNGSDSRHPAAFLLSEISETGLVCLPSMLTAVLLQANIRLSAEQSSYVLPSNFEEVATGILKVLNNLALIDVTFIQKMLARPDLKMEFFHLMSFLLSHCTNNWGVATDKIGSLVMESLSLLGYFALFHTENQAVLRWGKSPTILHRVCDLPFVFFSDPDLMPVLAGTLVAVSYGCEQNKGVIQQELSRDMLLPLLKSCKANLTTVSITNGDDSGEMNRIVSDRKDAYTKSSKNYLKSTRVIPQRNSSSSTTKAVRSRSHRDSKVVKLNEEMHLLNDQLACDASTLMLYRRLPVSFIDKAEVFFAAETTSNAESV